MIGVNTSLPGKPHRANVAGHWSERIDIDNLLQEWHCGEALD